MLAWLSLETLALGVLCHAGGKPGPSKGQAGGPTEVSGHGACACLDCSLLAGVPNIAEQRQFPVAPTQAPDYRAQQRWEPLLHITKFRCTDPNQV